MNRKTNLTDPQVADLMSQVAKPDGRAMGGETARNETGSPAAALVFRSDIRVALNRAGPHWPGAWTLQGIPELNSPLAG